MGDGVGTELMGGAHQMLGDKRTGDGGDQRVHALVHRIGLEGLHAVFVRELVAGVDDIRFDGTARQCAFLDGFEAFATLTDIEGDRHDILAGAFLQIRNGDGGIETTGVRQNKTILICHELPFFKQSLCKYIQSCVYLCTACHISGIVSRDEVSVPPSRVLCVGSCTA